jgi:ABC-2 type transport system permease protein
MTSLVFASTSLRRIVRDRTALFFLLALPILVMLIVGLVARGYGSFRVGVVDEGLGRGQLAQELITAFDKAPSLTVRMLSSRDTAATAIRRGEISAAIIVPAAFDTLVSSGGTASVTIVGEGATSNAQAARTAVEAVVTQHSARMNAARLAASTGGTDFTSALAVANRIQQMPPGLSATTEVVNGSGHARPIGFARSAPTMLVLFVFINTLAFSAGLIETRRLGIHARASASPVTAGTIVAGEALTYLAIAIGQALLLIVVGALAFGVRWGNPMAAGALVLVWALVGTGVSLLAGTLLRTPEQASAIGPAIGMGLGMLGGCMWPLEIVGPTMRTIGHLTPHAWAIDGWTKVVGNGATIGGIVRPLVILLAWAAVLFVLATARLRNRLTT